MFFKIASYFPVFLVMLCLACSGSSSPADEPKNYDPCELISLSEAEAALGVSLEKTRHDTKPINAVGQKICYYEHVSDMKFVQISINEQASMTNGMAVEKLYASCKSGLDNPLEISSVGDEAFYGGSGLTLGAGLTTLVKSKGIMMTVTVGLGTENNDQAAHISIEKTLAMQAIAKL